MKKLMKQEMKQLKGGVAAPPVGGGGCFIVSSSQGYTSCWYTSGDEWDLCVRVYGTRCNGVSNAPINCAQNNCIMN